MHNGQSPSSRSLPNPVTKTNFLRSRWPLSFLHPVCFHSLCIHSLLLNVMPGLKIYLVSARDIRKQRLWKHCKTAGASRRNAASPRKNNRRNLRKVQNFCGYTGKTQSAMTQWIIVLRLFAAMSSHWSVHYLSTLFDKNSITSFLWAQLFSARCCVCSISCHMTSGAVYDHINRTSRKGQ